MKIIGKNIVEITCKKLYLGRVSIKSYERREIINKKLTLVIIHNGKKMTLSPNEVKTKIKAKSALYTSKIGMEDYYLYDYKWNPDIEQ